MDHQALPAMPGYKSPASTFLQSIEDTIVTGSAIVGYQLRVYQ